MAHSSTRPRPRTILYAATTEATAREGAAALERTIDETTARTDDEPTVHPIGTPQRIREFAPEADCVVFAEREADRTGDGNPGFGLTANVDLLEVAEACGETPLVVFTDDSYASTASRSADRVDGYVRRGTDDAVSHLADEVERACHDVATAGTGSGGGSASAGSGSRSEPTGTPAPPPGDQRVADRSDVGGARPNAPSGPGIEGQDSPDDPTNGDAGETSGATTAVLEAAARLADCRDRERLFEQLIEEVVEVLGYEYCWIATVKFGDLVPRATSSAIPEETIGDTPVHSPFGRAFRNDSAVRIDLGLHDVLERPGENARSLYSVPVGDVGVLQVVVDSPETGESETASDGGTVETDRYAQSSDESDLEILESLCEYAATILERNWTERGLINERDRVRREQERLEAERDLLADASRRLETERDRLQRVFENVPDPAVRYELEDGRAVVRAINGAFAETFDADPDALTGEPIAEYTVPDGLEERAETLAAALRSGERQLLIHRRETVEGVRDFVLTAVPLETVVEGDDGDEDGDGDGDAGEKADADGELRTETGLLVYDDVTERKRRELEHAAATERLETIAELVDDDVLAPLNVARSYLELAEETGKEEHFRTIADAHEQLEAGLAALEALADADEAEPVAVSDVARRAWATVDTGDARLVTESDLVLEADRERLRELFEHVLETAVDGERTADAGSEPITVTVGATDDGFYVAGDRPANEDGPDGRQEAPTPGRLDGTEGAGLQLDAVEEIAAAHGWDVGVAEDEDGTAFAFRGVDALDLT
ncbi:GAF domain-containing protein [Halobiforma lacisalsi AJ5]|uniref:GAF domain-containing protein n=1 Tax=Natronobacterium lacisalsi AJ5 TaxID=358396 RepID=M0LMQ3_NATLA|nr:GAF domain-containing protein [Halobiforma lacisalsi]APW97067.1 GAF domain-containing protein [Halobiforma lacisalsi AJ5]EMA34786.1 GAF domain-containing protein [Halobiforma lacisalsi AJ5]